MKKTYIFAALIVFTAFCCHAETIDAGDVVVEELHENSLGVDQYARHSAKIESAKLEDGPETGIVEMFGSLSGVYFEKAGAGNYGAGNSAPSLFRIRGLGAAPNSGIITYIDGRPQYMGMWKHPVFDTLSLDSISSIELVKGAASVLYGNQAAAGAINIKTAVKKEEGVEAKLGLAGGSYFSQDYFISTLGKKGPVDFSLTGGYRSYDGKRNHSGSYAQNYGIKLGWDLNDEWRLGGSVAYTDAFFYNAGPDYAAAWDKDEEACGTIQKSYDLRLVKKDNEGDAEAIVYAEDGYNDFVKQRDGLGILRDGSDNIFANYGVIIKRDFKIFPGNNMTAGFDYRHFRGHFINYVPDASPYKRDVEWSENDYAPYFMMSQEAGIFGVSFGMRYGCNSKWGGEIIPQAGIKASIFDGNTVFINYAKGYKTPAMGQAVFSRYDSLVPENVSQYEAGVEHRVKGFLKASLTLFQAEGNNMLRTDPVDLKLKNTGFIITRGIETSAEVFLFDMMKIYADASYTDPREKTAGFAYLNGTFGAEFLLPFDIRLDVNADYSHDRFDADNKSTRLEDYVKANVRLSGPVDTGFTKASLFFDVSNIFDRRYQVKSGYPSEGIIVKGGCLVKF